MTDSQMVEMLKPCIDEGFVIQERIVGLFPFVCWLQGAYVTSLLIASSGLHWLSWNYDGAQ